MPRRPTSPALRPTSPALTSPHRRPSTLNNASTFSYNAEPPYPQLTHPSNDAISVGSLSMLGSQALSHRHSSGAYGFGTSKRYGGEMTQYISPAHLKSRLCVDSPGPSMCAAAVSARSLASLSFRTRFSLGTRGLRPVPN